MAIKGGDLIHVGNRILIDRAQTAGPGTVNIPTEKIYELGNYRSIAQIRDTPDLSFSLESFDVSAELESILLGQDFETMATGTALELASAKPIDVASQFKVGKQAGDPRMYDVLGSVAMPYLVLESMSYRFGISDNASQTATLRGDSIFYNPGSCYTEEFAGPLASGGTVTLANPANVYRGDVVAGDVFALSVTTLGGRRLAYGADYTEAATGSNADGSRSVTLTLTATGAVGAGDGLRVIYASPTVASYPQASHAPLLDSTLAAGTPAQALAAIRPAAIRGKHIEVFVGGTALTDRWTAVQSVNVDYRVTLDRDEEFSNPRVVAQDFDVPEVSGSIELRPRDYEDLFNKVRQAAGITDVNEVIGALSSRPLELAIVLHNPDGGEPLKTLYVPDARFNLPGYSGRVQQKLNVTMDWSSDGSSLSVVKGSRP